MKNDLFAVNKNRNISATTDPILLKFETQTDSAKPNVIVTKNEDDLS